MATPPTSPYCTPAEVAYFVRQLFPGVVTVPDFDDTDTIPSKTEVTFLTNLISSQVDMAFREVGYKIPWAARAGETWPESNTYFLKFLAVLGAAASVIDVLKPAPAMPEGQQYEQSNVYDRRFRGMLDAIRKASGQGFRATTYPSTPADRQLVERRGPMTDFGEGIIDGAAYLGVTEYTRLMASELKVWANYGGADVARYNYDILRMWGKR